MRALAVVTLWGLWALATGLGMSQPRGDLESLAVLGFSHRKLAQSVPGQAPANVDIPPATCERPTQFSFMVSLRNEAGEHTCGGALINDGSESGLSQWVLTTAHCVDSQSKTDAVLTPDVDISGRKRGEAIERIPATDTFIHPKWKADRKLGNDLALLKLNRTSCYRFPITIAERKFKVPENSSVLFVAFGREGPDAGFADQQQAGQFNIISKKECKKNFTQEGTVVRRSMTCARGPVNIGVCQGDEGSPLAWSPPKTTPEGRDPNTKRLVAVASFTDVDDCQSPDGTAFFTNVARFSKWIKKTVKRNS